MSAFVRAARVVATAILCALSLVAPTALEAGTVVQNCDASGTGSLADTIATAATGSVIRFAFDCPTANPIIVTSRLSISKNLTLDGTGHSIVISGNHTSGLFTVTLGNALTINLLTLTDASDTTAGGSAITNNRGTLTITNSTFSNNHADFDTGGGGAIISFGGTLTISGSTFVGNTSNGNSNGGGAILASGLQAVRGSVTISNSTFVGNTSNGTDAGGGAIDNEISPMTVLNDTFNGNAASGGGALFNNFQNGGRVTIANTIVAGNTAATTGPDALGTYTSGGHNVIGEADDSVGFTALTDQTGTIASPLNAALGVLANNGGQTQTEALLAGSPAIGSGDPAVCTAAPVNGLDQRGVPRKATTCSIGAFEAQPATPNPLPGTKPTAPAALGGPPAPLPLLPKPTVPAAAGGPSLPLPAPRP
ncbi:MAG: choice-of-anchor Q domain-containing protein [Thermomicrobiales bacterium]